LGGMVLVNFCNLGPHVEEWFTTGAKGRRQKEGTGIICNSNGEEPGSPKGDPTRGLAKCAVTKKPNVERAIGTTARSDQSGRTRSLQGKELENTKVLKVSGHID